MKGVPIKFKAKAKRGGYVWGVPSADDVGVIRFLLASIFYPDGVHYKRIEIFPDTLQQLIGYDHFGNEIYEGDMLVNLTGTEFQASLNGLITCIKNTSDCRYLENLKDRRQYYRLKG